MTRRAATTRCISGHSFIRSLKPSTLGHWSQSILPSSSSCQIHVILSYYECVHVANHKEDAWQSMSVKLQLGPCVYSLTAASQSNGFQVVAVKPTRCITRGGQDLCLGASVAGGRAVICSRRSYTPYIDLRAGTGRVRTAEARRRSRDRRTRSRFHEHGPRRTPYSTAWWARISSGSVGYSVVLASTWVGMQARRESAGVGLWFDRGYRLYHALARSRVCTQRRVRGRSDCGRVPTHGPARCRPI